MRLVAVLALCAAAAVARGEERTLDLGNGGTLRYVLLDATEKLPSARDSAAQVIGHLAAGDIDAVAVLSNAPQRRLEVLQTYRRAVGDDEFKKVFGQFLSPKNRIAAEIAIGKHRLLIWELGEAANHLAAQYYVDVEGRFLLDDVPSETRANLRRVLQSYRSAKP